VTEFIYRYNCHTSPDRAHVFMSFKLAGPTGRQTEVAALLKALAAEDMEGFDISDNEFAKSHARYMIGGSQVVSDERVLRFG
jgi:threonine dehydratase